jgi:hypothetical protein
LTLNLVGNTTIRSPQLRSRVMELFDARTGTQTRLKAIKKYKLPI